MRCLLVVFISLSSGIACNPTKSSPAGRQAGADDRSQSDENVDEGQGGATDGGQGSGTTDEDPTGGGLGSGMGNVGQPAQGEIFQFNFDEGCDHQWDLDGVVVDCLDCDVAFELAMRLNDGGSCIGGADRAGTLRASPAGVYFGADYWGYVFERSDGYLTWNTAGYEYGEGVVYYLGHLVY